MMFGFWMFLSVCVITLGITLIVRWTFQYKIQMKREERKDAE